MNALDTLSKLPQFIQTDTPRTLYNVLSNCLLTERVEAEGLVLKSGSLILTIEASSLEKYLKACALQAAMLLGETPP
jgi:hypothetical protein